MTLSTHVEIAKSLAVSPGRCLKIRQSLLGAQGCHWGLYEIFRPVSPPGELVGSRKLLVTQPKSRLRTRVFVRKHMVKDQHVDRQVVSLCGTELVHCEARALLLFFKHPGGFQLVSWTPLSFLPPPHSLLLSLFSAVSADFFRSGPT